MKIRLFSSIFISCLYIMTLMGVTVVLLDLLELGLEIALTIIIVYVCKKPPVFGRVAALNFANPDGLLSRFSQRGQRRSQKKSK
jgi:hypothetical protein